MLSANKYFENYIKNVIGEHEGEDKTLFLGEVLKLHNIKITSSDENKKGMIFTGESKDGECIIEFINFMIKVSVGDITYYIYENNAKTILEIVEDDERRKLLSKEEILNYFSKWDERGEKFLGLIDAYDNEVFPNSELMEYILDILNRYDYSNSNLSFIEKNGDYVPVVTYSKLSSKESVSVEVVSPTFANIEVRGQDETFDLSIEISNKVKRVVALKTSVSGDVSTVIIDVKDEIFADCIAKYYNEKTFSDCLKLNTKLETSCIPDDIMVVLDNDYVNYAFYLFEKNRDNTERKLV